MTFLFSTLSRREWKIKKNLQYVLKNSVILFLFGLRRKFKDNNFVGCFRFGSIIYQFLISPIQRLFNRLLSAVLTLWENIPDIFCKIWRSVQERKTPVHWQWFPTAGL